MPTKPTQYWIVVVDGEITGADGPHTADEARTKLLTLGSASLLFASPPIPWRQTVDLGPAIQVRVRKPRADKGSKRAPKVAT